VEDSVIETRSVYRAMVNVLNGDRRVGIEKVNRQVEYGELLILAGRAQGAKRVEVRRGHQLLGTAGVEDGRWTVAVPSGSLGMGKVSVVARAVYPDGRAVRSEPLEITVRESALVEAVSDERPPGEGLAVVVQHGSGGREEGVVEQLDGAMKRLAKLNAKGATLRFTGFLRAARPGFHQLAIASDGRVKVSMHGRLIADATLDLGGPEAFVAVGLQAGWHPIEIELRPSGKRAYLKVVMAGEQVPAVLGNDALAHQ
jgi:hypothetical protein